MLGISLQIYSPALAGPHVSKSQWVTTLIATGGKRYASLTAPSDAVGHVSPSGSLAWYPLVLCSGAPQPGRNRQGEVISERGMEWTLFLSVYHQKRSLRKHVHAPWTQGPQSLFWLWKTVGNIRVSRFSAFCWFLLPSPGGTRYTQGSSLLLSVKCCETQALISQSKVPVCSLVWGFNAYKSIFPSPTVCFKIKSTVMLQSFGKETDSVKPMLLVLAHPRVLNQTEPMGALKPQARPLPVSSCGIGQHWSTGLWEAVGLPPVPTVNLVQQVCVP